MTLKNVYNLWSHLRKKAHTHTASMNSLNGNYSCKHCVPCQIVQRQLQAFHTCKNRKHHLCDQDANVRLEPGGCAPNIVSVPS